MNIMSGVKYMSVFRNWLEEERVKRGLSVPEFARFLGIGETTLRTFIRENNPQIPGRINIQKIHIATSTPLVTLMEMIDPITAERARSRDNAEFLVELIESLDEQKRKHVLALINSLLGDDE
jgi:transcriptional regulator with XRE-family HTH domain